MRRLNVFQDIDDLWRVGRLKYEHIHYSAKHTIILPRSSSLTKHYQEEYFHVGPNQFHFLLLRQYWILSPRRAINSVMSRCVRCFEVKPVPYQPPMGNRSKSRLSTIKSFSHYGCDYSGPFTIAPMRKCGGQKTSTACICLFVCHSMGAIHLEFWIFFCLSEIYRTNRWLYRLILRKWY